MASSRHGQELHPTRLCTDLDLHVEAVPVDYAASALVRISLVPASIGKTFHFANPHTLPWNQLIAWIGSVGYPIRKVSYEEWKIELLRDAKVSSANAMYPLVPLLQEPSSQERLFSSSGTPRFSCKNTEEGLSGTGIECPPLDAQLLATYFTNFVQNGFLPPPEGMPSLEALSFHLPAKG